MIVSILSQQATQKKLDEADHLWQAGQKAEAVAKYRSVLDGGVTSIDNLQRVTIFQRVIEFEAEQGNVSAAKALIQKAVDFDVSVSFNNPVAKILLAEVQAEKERAEMASSPKPDNGNGDGPAKPGVKAFSVKVGARTVQVEVAEAVAEEIELKDLVYNKMDWRIGLKIKLLKPIARRYTKWAYTLYDKAGVALASSELVHPNLGIGETGVSYLYLGPDNKDKAVRITLP